MKKLKSVIVSLHPYLANRKGDLAQTNSFVKSEILKSAREDLVILSLTSIQNDRPELPESMLIKTAAPTPIGELLHEHASGPYLGRVLNS